MPNENIGQDLLEYLSPPKPVIGEDVKSFLSNTPESTMGSDVMEFLSDGKMGSDVYDYLLDRPIPPQPNQHISLNEMPSPSDQAPDEAIKRAEYIRNLHHTAFKYALLPNMEENERIKLAETGSYGDVIANAWGIDKAKHPVANVLMQGMGAVLDTALSPETWILNALPLATELSKLPATDKSTELMQKVVADFKAGNMTPEVENLITKGRTAPETQAFKDYLSKKGYSFAVDVPAVPEGQGIIRPEAAEVAAKMGPGAIAKQAQGIAPSGEPESMKAGNINLKHFTQPEVRQTIRDVVGINPEVGKTPKISAEGQIDISKRVEDKVMNAMQSIIDSEHGSLAGAQIKTRTEAAAYIVANIGKQSVDELRAAVEPLIQRTQRVSEEIGRGLESHKRPIEAEASAIKAINEKIAELKSMTEPGNTDVKSAIESLNGLKDQISKHQPIEPGFIDKAYEVFLNGIFSGFKTHIVNTASNTAFTAISPIERTAAAIVDVPASWITGKRAVYFSEVPGQLKGMARSVLPSSYGQVPVAPGQKFAAPPAIKNKYLGPAVRLPTAALKVEDVIFKHVNGIAELEASARATARSEGLKGEEYASRVADLIANPTGEMSGRITAEQLGRTFQTEADKVASEIMRLRRTIPGARWLIPVVRTAANIYKEAMLRTPLGIPMTAARAYKGTSGGKEFGQREISQGIGASLLGTAVTLGAAWLWAKGRITGNAPKERGKKDLFYQEGKQPNAIKVGDSWYPSGMLEPTGTATSLVVNFIQDYAEHGKDPSPKKIAELIDGIGATLLRSPYLQGAFEGLNLIKEPAESGLKIFNGIASGAIPYSGALRNIERQVDPTLREPDRDSIVRGFYESLIQNIPWASQYVPEKLNLWGEPVTLSKSYITKETPTKLTSELNKLDINPQFPGKYFGDVRLDRDTYRELHVLTGQQTKKLLDAYVNADGWDRLPDPKKKEIMEDTISKVRQQMSDKIRSKVFLTKFNSLESKEEKANYIGDMINRKFLTKTFMYKLSKGKIR